MRKRERERVGGEREREGSELGVSDREGGTDVERKGGMEGVLCEKERERKREKILYIYI